MSASKCIDIWCPWITEYGTSILLDVAEIKSDVEINLYFRLLDEDIVSGMLDVKGLHTLIRRGRRIRFFENPNLHAKMFLVDKNKAIAGSNNLTQRAFELNYEIAFYSENCENISAITEGWFFREVFAAEIWAKHVFLEELRKKHPESFLNDETSGNPNEFKNLLYGMGLRGF